MRSATREHTPDAAKRHNAERPRRAGSGIARLPPATGDPLLLHARDGARPAPASGPRYPYPHLGPGWPLPPAERASFEPGLGTDLSHVRIHTSPASERSARLVGARAFTAGSSVAFAAGTYRPSTVAGRDLLAHELTHVAENRGDDGAIARDPEDARRQSITPQWAANLSSSELSEQIRLLRIHLAGLDTGSEDYANGRANLEILETEASMPGRQVVGPVGTVPRPPGLPLDEGFMLVPATGLDPALAQLVPEGKIVSLPVPAAPVGAGGGLQEQAMQGAGPAITGGAVAGLTSHGSYVRTYGLAAAGPDAIGVVSFPRYDVWNPLRSGGLPQNRLLWGHTAVYVRQGGKISIIRSFAPESLVATGVEDLVRSGAVKAGERGVPGRWYTDSKVPGRGIPMWQHVQATSVEYPVTPAVAKAAAESLPSPGRSGLYTGDPSRMNLCSGQNCIRAAVPFVEEVIGGKVGPARGPTGVPTSVTDLSRAGELVPDAASQGRMFSWMRAAGRDPGAIAPAPGATGPAVVGKYSTAAKVFRWGGRLFFVAGMATIPVETALAPPEEKVKTAVSATAGFAGGVAAGAAVGLACGPGAPVCSVVGGIIGGIVGGAVVRSFFESLFEAGDSAPCPSCHAMQRDWANEKERSMLLGPPGGSMPSLLPPVGAPRTGALTEAETRALIEFIQSTAPAGGGAPR